MNKCKLPETDFEVVAAIGRRTRQRRKVLVIVGYLPPDYNASKNKPFMEYVCDSILTLKRKYSDPYIILGGDFNKRNIREAINYYKDIKVVKTPPTRAGSVLDIIATNLADCEVDSGVGPPITSSDGTASDHGVVYSSFRMPRVPQYKISSYLVRVAPDCNRSYCEDSFSGYSGSV